MKTHAEVLGVEYLIWDGKIWSLARDNEGGATTTAAACTTPAPSPEATSITRT